MKVNYDLISEQWCNVRTSLPAKDKELFGFFIRQLPKHSNVLDLGCGSGIPVAKRLTDKGVKLKGIDQLASLLRKARINVPTGDFKMPIL